MPAHRWPPACSSTATPVWWSSMQGQPPTLQLPLERLAEGVPLPPLAQPDDQTTELLSSPEQTEADPDPVHQDLRRLSLSRDVRLSLQRPVVLCSTNVDGVRYLQPWRSITPFALVLLKPPHTAPLGAVFVSSGAALSHSLTSPERPRPRSGSTRMPAAFQFNRFRETQTGSGSLLSWMP